MGRSGHEKKTSPDGLNIAWAYRVICNKVQESRRGESPKTVCLINYNYEHCNNATEVAKLATPGCSRPQQAQCTSSSINIK